MLLDSITDDGSWTEDLLESLPQSTIPQTAQGIARADTFVQAYQPTTLFNADGTLASGNAPVSPAVAKSPSFFDSLLGDISKVLGATGINVSASGAGVVVQQQPSTGKTYVNTTGAPNFTQSPYFWLALAVVGGAFIYSRRR